eukprot:3603138-Prymnesium_polylepis.1
MDWANYLLYFVLYAQIMYTMKAISEVDCTTYLCREVGARPADPTPHAAHRTRRAARAAHTHTATGRRGAPGSLSAVAFHPRSTPPQTVRPCGTRTASRPRRVPL